MSSQASRWLDGFAAATALLGAREDLVAMLPENAPLPRWWEAFVDAPTREARAARLAPHALRLRTAVEEAAPRWP